MVGFLNACARNPKASNAVLARTLNISVRTLDRRFIEAEEAGFLSRQYGKAQGPGDGTARTIVLSEKAWALLEGGDDE